LHRPKVLCIICPQYFYDLYCHGFSFISLTIHIQYCDLKLCARYSTVAHVMVLTCAVLQWSAATFHDVYRSTTSSPPISWFLSVGFPQPPFHLHNLNTFYNHIISGTYFWWLYMHTYFQVQFQAIVLS
jgi:hypothetical protein